MKDIYDLITAIKDQEKCPWCNHQPDTWWDKFWDRLWYKTPLGKPHLSGPWPKIRTFYTRYIHDWTYYLRIWELGAAWCHRYHKPDKQRFIVEDSPRELDSITEYFAQNPDKRDIFNGLKDDL